MSDSTGDVVNMKDLPDGWQRDPSYVYIGRAGKGLGGYFGSPVQLNQPCPECGMTHARRGSSLACYEKYLERRLGKDPAFAEAVRQLVGKKLVCFCSPSPCHGTLLAMKARKLNETHE